MPRSTFLRCVAGGMFALTLLMDVSSALAQPAGPVPPPPPPERERRGRMDEPTLTVTGTGESFGTPDRAVVRLGAVAQATQAADAQKQVAEVVAKTVEAVKQLGVDEKNIRTAGASVTITYRLQPGDRAPGGGGKPTP